MLILFLHEMMHLKRIKHYAEGKYFNDTPEKILDKFLNSEAEEYLEN